ncbi:general amidase [Teratosphaeria destructans]|uniref:General amidase n=1 Tax=Teratosphaeria destructans TaxID=418781 RepID=A0A9W7W4F9_9PEZI|nr:general amidase [Teratosphaeria destructans]
MVSRNDDTWQERAAAKVASTYSKIPSAWRLGQSDLERAKATNDLTGPFIEAFLTPQEIAIIHLDAQRLLTGLVARSLTCVEVTTAYCKTAAIAHQINNCLHEIFFDEALRRAAELDREYEDYQRLSGPLHGLPVSLKDQFHVMGHDTTMGYVGWIDSFEGSTDPNLVHRIQSQVVDELLAQGAVLYCKTSLPQTLMYGETINNLIGQTCNPISQRLSCGGSSGGEAALQALKGSIVGLGTDIGGSVRIPAAFCGTYSLKPTHDRLSYRNVANTNPGQLNYPSSVGIMGRSSDSLKLIMTALLACEPWHRDPAVVPLPWRQSLERATTARADDRGKATDDLPLKVGILYDDGFMRPHPPIERGLRIVDNLLRSAGHKVIDWNPPPHRDLAEIHLRFLQSDGAYDIHKQLELSGEPLIPPLRDIFKLVPPLTAIETQELSVEGRVACESYLEYWNSKTADDGQAVDAVIMPVAPHAAVLPGRYLYTGYTEVVNLLDYCTCVVPVTRADQFSDKADTDYSPHNELDARNWTWYDAEAYHGAPVGLQIVCKKYEEEKVWAIGEIVTKLLKDPQAATAMR